MSNPFSPSRSHSGVTNSPGESREPFLSDDDREFVARCWIAILLFCAVSWVAFFKFLVLPLFA
jgi:hypothetical protein